MVSTFRLRLFGAAQVERDGDPLEGFKSRKALVLLGYLATQDQPVERSFLTELFWPDKSEARGRNNLSQILHNLLTLWPGCLQSDRYTVQFFHSDAHWIDIKAFEVLREKGDLNSLALAVELYQGDFMAGMYLDDCPEFEQWLSVEQESWRRRVTQVLCQLIKHHTGQNEPGSALKYAARLLTIDPCQEETHRQKMLLLAQSGQRSAALAQYEVCCRILRDELGVEPEAETVALYEQIRIGASNNKKANGVERAETAPSILMPSIPSLLAYNNLPAQSTSFIGRETELAVIGKRLGNPDCRLLSIIGLGGIGKTRLALQAATATDAFRHGVCFIPLTSVRSADFLISTIADTLDFPLYGRGDPKTQLTNFLSDKELLLVMDNFEHLLTGAGLLAEILERASRVKILVTSRERLNLQEEWVLDLQGLSYPKGRGDSELEQYSAVQLFLHRAQQARADFWLTYMDKRAIARICRLVEGLPLAIELAATWTRTFSCEDIASEIEQNYDFLTTSLKNIPRRHRSLRAVFAHSWKLLSDKERCVYCKLSVFWGSFNRESAEQVVGASAVVLSTLVDKSLLSWTAPDRYEIHELLRQYAAEKLSKNPEDKHLIKAKHCQHYASFLAEQEARVKQGQQQKALEAISIEIDNVRAGWYWAVKHRRAEEFEKYCESLFLIHNMQSWFREGEAIFRLAAASLRQTPETAVTSDSGQETRKMLGKVLARQGVFCASLGLYDEARTILEEGLAIFEDLQIRQSSPLSLTYLGAIAWALGEYSRAKQLCQESLAITKACGDRWKEALVHEYLGMIAISLGNYEEAKELAQRCLAIFRGFDFRSGIAFSLNLLGIAARNLGEYDEAKQVCQESLTISREIGDRWEEALSLQYLGMIAIGLGEYAAAKTLAQKSVAIYREFDYRSGLAFSLNLVGIAARNLGKFEEAKQVHTEVLQTCREMDYPLGIALASYYLGRIAHLQGDHLTAEQKLTDSLRIAKRLAYQRGVTQNLNILGNVAFDQGKYEEAEKYLYEALRMTQTIHAAPMILDILTGLAHLLAQEGKKERAVELLAFPLNHAASKKETKDKAHHLFSQLTPQLPRQIIETAEEKGKAGKLDELVAEILKEKTGERLALAYPN
jgi:predicted ATPase/DNA-binding SARP family transcriptional activator